MSIRWFLLLLLFAFNLLYASPTVVSLERIYQQSINYYPNQLIAKQNVSIAHNEAKMARSRWLPTLDFTVDWVRHSDEDLNYQEGKVSVSQAVYNRQYYYGLEGSDLSVQISQIQQTERRQQLLIEIADLYTQVLIQQEQINLIEQSILEAEMLKKIAQKALALKQKSVLDLLRSEANLEEQQAELVEAQTQLQVQEKKLLSYSTEHYPNPFWQPFNAEDFIKTDDIDTFEHPSLRRIQWEQKKELNAWQQDRSDYYPTVDLSLEYAQRNSHSQLLQQDISTNESQAMLSMNWNLFSGLANLYAVDNASIRIQQKNNEYDQNVMDINHQIANTQAIVTASQRKLQSLNRALRARQLALETVEKSWKLNLIDVSEVLKEQRSVHEIELNILTEERKQDMEKLRLYFLTGRLK